MKRIRIGVAALCVASMSQAQLIDDFSSGSLTNYTMTRILNNSGGANDLVGVINSEALDFTSTAHAGPADQYAFIYNGLGLAVGEEVQVDISWFKTSSGSANESLGLYVGKAPTAEVREDYVSVYAISQTYIKARGFDGTTELGAEGGPASGLTALFIARIGATDFEVGYYAGATRNVVATREGMDPANDASAVGFYIDTRGVGSIGAVDNLAIALPPPVYAVLEASNTNGTPGVEVEFIGTNSTTTGEIISYNWDFGDGSTNSGGVVTHSYLSVGTYTAMLTVVDALSNSNSATVEINVTEASMHSGIVYQDDFSGSSASVLNGLAPDIDNNGGTNLWVAGDIYMADGSVDTTNLFRTATLAFKPDSFKIYQLDIRVDTDNASAANWLACGFANGQSLNTSRFVQSPVTGRAWASLKGNGDVNEAQGAAAVQDVSFINGFDTITNKLDIRIVLNTKGSHYTATWYAKLTTDSDYTLVRDTFDLTSTDITSVGFATSGAAGMYDSFQLQVIGQDATAATLTMARDGENNVVVGASGMADFFSVINTLQGTDNLINTNWISLAATSGVSNAEWVVPATNPVTFFRVLSE